MLFDTEVQHCSYSVEKNILKNQEYFFLKHVSSLAVALTVEFAGEATLDGWMGGRMDGGVYEWIDR